MRLLTPRVPWFALAALLAGCSGGGSTTAPATDSLMAQAPAAKAVVESSEKLHQLVGRLTSRRQEGMKVGVTPSGLRSFTAPEGMGQVVMARQNADGSITTKCVGSEVESRSFLAEPASAARSGNTR